MIDIRVGPPAEFSWTSSFQIAVALAVLAGSAWRAWVSARNRAPEGSFAVRVLIPALVFSVAFSLLLSVENGSPGGEAVLFSLFILLVLGLFSVMLILLAELIAWRLRPFRSRAWIVGALLLFLACFLIPPSVLLAWLAPSAVRGLLQWDALEMVALIGAAGLIWWSYLPLRAARLGPVFE